MNKLNLDLDDLDVDSFTTSAEDDEPGTVQGQGSYYYAGSCDLNCGSAACSNYCEETEYIHCTELINCGDDTDYASPCDF
jgi:hypothetical protein